MCEYARWYKPVVILDGLVFLVVFTAIISGGENGEIIGSYGSIIALLLFGLWFWHMKSVQAKSLRKDNQYYNQPHQEKISITCAICGNKDSNINEGLCPKCQKQTQYMKEKQMEQNKVNTSKKVNYYQLLNVDENASQDNIQKRWRELAKEFHPDKAPNSSIAEDEFVIYRKAYEILSDPKRRQEYDSKLNHTS